jgi:hypothetical protein
MRKRPATCRLNDQGLLIQDAQIEARRSEDFRRGALAESVPRIPGISIRRTKFMAKKTDVAASREKSMEELFARSQSAIDDARRLRDETKGAIARMRETVAETRRRAFRIDTPTRSGLGQTAAGAELQG